MSPTKMMSTRIDENLLAEVDNYAAAKDVTRSDAIQALLSAGLFSEASGAGVAKERSPGWDAKEIARIAHEYYQGLGFMFDAHQWPERGSQMLTVVQSRVSDTYGSVEKFVELHSNQTPEEFRDGLPALPNGRRAPLGIILPSEQREFMRKLVAQHGSSPETVCAIFAEALKSGTVSWQSNMSNITPEQYAIMVWIHGQNKGWLEA